MVNGYKSSSMFVLLTFLSSVHIIAYVDCFVLLMFLELLFLFFSLHANTFFLVESKRNKDLIP